MALSGINRNTEKFIIKSFDVYVDDDTTPTFYSEGEKTISFSAEFAEFTEGVPSSLVRKDLTKFNVAVAFTFKDYSSRALQLARGGEHVRAGGYKYVYFGTDYTEASTHKYTFTGETVDGKSFELIVLKGAIAEMPDITIGGGDYAGVPVVIQALKDTSVSDASRDLAYFKLEE